MRRHQLRAGVIWEGNNLDTLRSMPANSVDSIVTDPPYGLSFMGKKWDYDVPSVELWAECLRVLKPGGHLLAFAGTRTQHRMAVRIEDAGFEIRDMIAWVYGSGFPKSKNVALSIDKGEGQPNRGRAIPVASTFQASDEEEENRLTSNPVEEYRAKTERAAPWEGWGTALKPALEPVTVARKPFDTTVAENVLTHGTGGLNIDGCRVATEDTVGASGRWGFTGDNGWNANSVESRTQNTYQHNKGRWPANLIHDGSEEVVAGFPMTTSGTRRARQNDASESVARGRFAGNESGHFDGDTGSSARFFYCAKASKADRDEGCAEVEPQQRDESRKQGDPGGDNPRNRGAQPRANHHPTVKPTDLMRYLCRLVTPPGGIVLDPFMGSGSTGKAAALEGFRFIGCEIEPEYVAIATKRIAAVEVEEKDGEQPKQLSLFGGAG